MPCLFFGSFFSRVHEDNRHILLPNPVLSSVGMWNSAAQSRLCVWDTALLHSLWSPGVAEI